VRVLVRRPPLRRRRQPHPGRRHRRPDPGQSGRKGRLRVIAPVLQRGSRGSVRPHGLAGHGVTRSGPHAPAWPCGHPLGGRPIASAAAVHPGVWAPMRLPGAVGPMFGLHFLTWHGGPRLGPMHPRAWWWEACRRHRLAPGSVGSGGWPARSAGRFRRRCEVAGGDVDGAAGWGWWCSGRRVVGAVASRPHGPPDDEPGTTRSGCPGRWGRRPASATGDGPHTRPGAARSREDTAAVADGQGPVLGGADDPAGPA
jgi:hypothetical protein